MTVADVVKLIDGAQRFAPDGATGHEPHRDADCQPPPFAETGIHEAEMESARLTPDCIVTDYLFADVALLAGPGGTGKTTLLLHEMMQIARGQPVHGLAVHRHGWCLLVTAEDRREHLAARLREMMAAHELNPAERAAVLAGVRVWDVTGQPVKLVTAAGGNVVLTELADAIIAKYRDNPPVLVTFDPLASFGASEAMINDNEQAVVTAARRIVRALGCCVRIVCHTGKTNAREGRLDQYAARGGSALSDGARMIAVLQPWNANSGEGPTPPMGCRPGPDVSLVMLARPKLSYSRPNPPLIWVRREGWLFDSHTEVVIGADERDRATLAQVATFLASEVRAGHRHTRNTLEQAVPGLPRADTRRAIALLMAHGRIVEAELPKGERRGGRKSYLAISGGEVGAEPGAIQ